MKQKTVEVQVEWGTVGGIGVGEFVEPEWIIEKISFVGVSEYGTRIICDCVYADNQDSGGVKYDDVGE